MQRLLTLLARFESASHAPKRKARLPPVLVLSDDQRGYRLEDQLTRWPTGAAFIDRTFGQLPQPKRHRARPYVQLATCTPAQARAAKLDGVHWPQGRLSLRRVSATRGLVETASAHGGLAIAKASRLGFDAILVSTAFASESPSASRPLGSIRLARLQQAFPQARIYALGGITAKSAWGLTRTCIHGVALVSFKISKG